MVSARVELKTRVSKQTPNGRINEFIASHWKESMSGHSYSNEDGIQKPILVGSNASNGEYMNPNGVFSPSLATTLRVNREQIT